MKRKIVFVAAAFFLAFSAFWAWTPGWAGEQSGQHAVSAPATGGQGGPKAAPPASSDADRQAAITAAEAWLGLVDDLKYTESYKEAGALFRNSVAEQEWLRAIATFRGPHGKAVSRKKISTSTSPDEPALPEGEYVVIEYETNFEKKKDCKEKVTCMKESDGKWRVVGYHLTQSAPESETPPSAPSK